MGTNNIFSFLFLIFFIINNVTGIDHKFTFLIAADDLGWNDISSHGSTDIPTPCIDALLSNGMTFLNFYTLPSCTPSRTALLTGNYPIRAGMQGWPIEAGQPRNLSANVVTLPNLLEQINCNSYLIGKWHLGSGYRSDLPMGHGFSKHCGIRDGHAGYFNYELQENIYDNEGFNLYENYSPGLQYVNTYATDLYTAKTIEYLDEHINNYPDKKGFFFVSQQAPHAGYKGVLEVPDPVAANQKFWYISNPNRRLYAESVSILDKSVCTLVKEISNRGILGQSLIIFISDNGAQTFGKFANYGSNYPFAGQKMTILQGGVKNTVAIFSPHLAKFQTVNTQYTHITDLFPTIYSSLGGDSSKLTLDGIDLWPLLSEGVPTKIRSDILINIDEKEGNGAIVSTDGFKLTTGNFMNNIYAGNYGDKGRSRTYNATVVLKSDVNLEIQKLQVSPPLTESKIYEIRNQLDYQRYFNPLQSNYLVGCQLTGDYCLFNLNSDPRETKNVKNSYPQKFEELKVKLAEYWSQLVPQNNKPVDPASNPANCFDRWHTWLEDDPALKCS